MTGEEAEGPPLPLKEATRSLARCAITTVRLLAKRQIRQPTDHVGDVLFFADGTSASVYRETVVPREVLLQPAALVVEFRLRWICGRGHALFRAESLLNTPLFVGFPGFISKLWLRDDQKGRYRGVYQWDDAALAHAYARALWWVLALVSTRGSIHYTVIPHCTRAALLDGVSGQDGDWWRVSAVHPRNGLP